jgi:hypothetical protein
MASKQPEKKLNSEGDTKLRLKSPIDQFYRKRNFNIPNVLVKDLKESDKSEENTNDGSIKEGFITQKVSPQRKKNTFQTLNRRKKKARYMNYSIIRSPKKSKFLMDKGKGSPTNLKMNSPKNNKVSSPCKWTGFLEFVNCGLQLFS